MNTASPLNTTADNTTQAMTEVALGLSMAFFALLILALLSMGAGSVSQQPLANEASISVVQSLDTELADSQGKKEEVEESDASTGIISENINYLFYFEGTYFDEQLNPITKLTSAVDPSAQSRLVVAVDPDLSFSQVMKVHQDFAQYGVQITSMDNNWLRALESTK
ncbi:hypothetical protein PN836_001720 [Ningiella sp. W23]|uniref:hypothetical protein n=1 Tax=Ningiella sp. W23 TaxID=3023715 RepID=UPI003756347B